ncbi:MAG: bacterio-opsin activator domain-containing protein [Halodesulfurarchaeum sp.]
MEQLIIYASIALRLLGVVYSIGLLYRVEDARFGFFTITFALMASRQLWTLYAGTPGLGELPGLIVSVFALLAIVYVSRYIEEERQIRETVQRKNERLRTFQKAIEHAGHAIFLTDTDGRITYANQAVESVTGYARGEVLGEDPSLWKSGEHDEAFYDEMWETILSGDVWEGQIVNERKDGSKSWVDMTIAPIIDDGEVEQFVAIDTDITERRERKEKITEQNQRLAVLNHTNEVLRDVNKRLVQASARKEVEAGVCEEFAGASPYDFAWIAIRSVTSDALRPREWAGIDEDELRDLMDRFDERHDDPVSVAMAEETVEIEELSTDVEGARTVAAVPITYDGTTYGALCVATTDPESFESIETGVFSELGATVGYAVNAIESKETLMTDSVTEIEFQTRDADCFSVALSRELDCSLNLRWVSPTDTDSLVEYFSVTGVDPNAVANLAADHSAIDDVQVVTDGENEGLFRFDVTGSCVARTLGEFGSDLSLLRVDDGRATVRAHLAESGDVRTLLEALQDEHGDVELTARRQRERPRQTVQEVRATLDERLTDRQREALQTAYIGGFFEWPRESSGEEIAEIMDINQSTFLQHLRAAERKVLSVLLDADQSRRAVPVE